MTTRRGFLRSVGAGAAASVLQWPAPGFARTSSFEPPRASQPEGPILLYSNENAYGPSPKVVDAIQSAAAGVNRYPRMKYGSLTEQIAASHNVKPEQILLGAGSTEILRVAAFAFLGNDKQLIHASPTFEAIEHYARSAGAETIPVPLTPVFAHDLNGMLSRAGASTTLIYICNPNNPTASLTPRKDLESFIAKLPASTIVIIDEAYHHFAGQSGSYSSFIDHPVEDERVIVARTFSKVYGMAGLRLGYAVAAPKLVQQMRKFTNEDNINAIATYAAFAALNDSDAVNEQVRRNANDRQEFFNQAMARMLKPIDSHTNFVMMNTYHPTDEVIQHFRQHNILIGRRFPPMDTFIRVSLGRPEEMIAFWHAWDALPYPHDVMVH
jgi:histidinol-phosphate aminotransferase